MAGSDDLLRLIEQHCQKDATSGCWLWQRGKDSHGYGYMWHMGKVRKVTRLVMEASGHLMVDGVLACHHCDMPSCVNPAHLFAGTQTENMRDAKAKGRTAKGATHGRTKCSADAVREIFEMRSSGHSQRAIAARFGLTHSGIQHILQNRISQ